MSDHCAGDFALGQLGANQAPVAVLPPIVPQTIETWGEFDPGKGFLIGRSVPENSRSAATRSCGTSIRCPPSRLSPTISGTTTDRYPQRHLPAPRHGVLERMARHPEADVPDHPVDRASTDQNAIFGTSATSSRKFSVYAGLNGYPGPVAARLASLLARTRSRDGRRVLPAVISRPASGRRASPSRASGTTSMVGNNLSALGVSSRQLDRTFATGASIWWMPTTQGVRSAGRLRRLRDAREGRDAVRRLHDAQPGGSIQQRRRAPRQHDPPAGRQREPVRHGRAGAAA